MSLPDPTPENNAPPSPTFESVELVGGPHDGQHMRVPVDEDKITLRSGEVEHVYLRLNRRPVLRHQGGLAKVLGGGR